MKKINNVYLATKKDGSTEEILKKLPPRQAGYSAVFTNLPPKDAEKNLKMLSGIDEDLHPTMLIPLLLFFTMTPKEATGMLIDRNEKYQMKFDRFINSAILQIIDWLNYNKIMIADLLAYCDGIYIEDIGDDWFKINNYKTDAKIEKSYLDDAINAKDKTKRMKIIAGLDLLCHHQDMLMAMEKNYASDAVMFTFLFARSLAQFAAVGTEKDGRDVQRGRRNQKAKNRPGLTALRRTYKERYPKASEAMLWKFVKRDLIKEPFQHGEYTVEYTPEPTGTKETAGWLKHIDENGDESSIQYETFRKIKFR